MYLSKLIAGLPALCLSVSAACAGSFLSTGVDFSSGKYGGDVRSESTEILADFSYSTDQYQLGVAFSHLRLTGVGVNIPGIGPVRPVDLEELATTRPRLAERLQGALDDLDSTEPTTADGFGDIVLFGTWFLRPPESGGLIPSMTAEAKLGTADAESGLGSGENDYSLALGVERAFGDFGIGGQAGYRVLGDPEGYDLNNIAFVALSAWRSVGSASSISMDTEFASRAADDVDHAATLGVSYHWNFGNGGVVALHANTGLTDASADLTAGAQLGWQF